MGGGPFSRRPGPNRPSVPARDPKPPPTPYSHTHTHTHTHTHAVGPLRPADPRVPHPSSHPTTRGLSRAPPGQHARSGGGRERGRGARGDETERGEGATGASDGGAKERDGEGRGGERSERDGGARERDGEWRGGKRSESDVGARDSVLLLLSPARGQ